MIWASIDTEPIVDAYKWWKLIRAAIRFLEPRVGHKILRFAAKERNEQQAAQHHAGAYTEPPVVLRLLSHLKSIVRVDRDSNARPAFW